MEIANLPPIVHKRVLGLMPKIKQMIGVEKIIIFPMITNTRVVGLMEISYRDRSQGSEDIVWMRDMLGQITSIFARKSLEEEVGSLQAQQKLILDSAAEGIVGMDMEGRHIFVNPIAAQMLGYEVDELLNKQNHQLYHREVEGEVEEIIGNCPIYAGASLKNRQAQETIFLRKDGSSFPTSYVGSPTYDAGKQTGIVFAFRDISEQVEATREIARLAQVVEQANISVVLTNINAELTYG